MKYLFFKAHRNLWMKGPPLQRFPMRFSFGILGLLVLVVFSSSCSEKSAKPAPAPIPVVVEMVIQKEIPVQIRAIGNVQAYSTVTVEAKVGGELVRVHSPEGQDVKKGALLFTIDDPP